MAISGIISVSGRPGLFKIVTQTKNGLIAESLMDQKRIPIYASQKVSALEEISIYTEEDDLPLAEVFDKMFKVTAGKKAIDHKASPDELKKFFQTVISNYDQERVYNSDLKKLFQWFNLLVDKGLLKPEKEKKKKTTAATKDKADKSVEKKAAKPKAKPIAKKSTPKATSAKSAPKSTPRKVGGGK